MAATPAMAQALETASYVPHRVYEAGHAFADFETMLAALGRSDVVFVGEQHGDPATHRLQLAILEGLHRRGRTVVLSLEMFERDAQAALDQYLADRLTEEEFLAQARPWPRYQTDYRPLVEFARALGWRVVAANVPRPIAASVSQAGLRALEALPDEERALAAERLDCPVGDEDEYFRRFAEQMRKHPAPADPGDPRDPADPGDPVASGFSRTVASGFSRTVTSGFSRTVTSGSRTVDQQAMVERFYHAQCVKDETMAESIARAAAASAGAATIVHVTGAFHSDFGLGSVARAARRLPDATIRTVSVLPVPDLDAIDVAPHAGRADYLLFAWRPARRHP